MTLAIADVSLDDLQARLVLRPDGRSNLEEAFAKPGAPAPAKRPAKPAKTSGAKPAATVARAPPHAVRPARVRRADVDHHRAGQPAARPDHVHRSVGSTGLHGGSDRSGGARLGPVVGRRQHRRRRHPRRDQPIGRAGDHREDQPAREGHLARHAGERERRRAAARQPVQRKIRRLRDQQGEARSRPQLQDRRTQARRAATS